MMLRSGPDSIRRSAACKIRKMQESRIIGNDEWLTQAGDVFPSGGYNFPHALRTEEEMSLILGVLPPTAACDIRAAGERRRRTDRDAARHARAGRLRDLGFRIEHTPDPMNEDHVSAYWEDGVWDEKAAGMFCRAFSAPNPRMEGAPGG